MYTISHNFADILYIHVHVHVGPYRYAIYNVSLLWCTPVPYKCMHRYSSTQGVCVYIVMYVHVKRWRTVYTNSTSIIGVPEHVWDVRDNTVTFFMAHTVRTSSVLIHFVIMYMYMYVYTCTCT